MFEDLHRVNLEFALAVVAVQYCTASAVVQPHLVVEVDAEPAVGVDSVVRERVAAGQEPLGAARVRAEPRRLVPGGSLRWTGSTTASPAFAASPGQ